MSMYSIGFVIAFSLYLIHVTQRGRDITKLSVVIAILLGLLSWFGVIISLFIMSLVGRRQD